MLQYVRSFILRWFGVKVDYHKAAWLYKKACDGKSAIACSNLGDQYRDGIGVKQDLHKAIELYEKACEGKYAESCFYLVFL